jgi:catechol 2,3-dioxygenase-like lactoylglutathione lyase family enzyme
MHTGMQIKINHIQHVGLPVTNLEASEAFYKELGFSNVMTSEFEHQGARGAVAMMRNGPVTLELYQMPEAQLQEIRGRSDGRIDHVAFDVDDIDATFASLKNASFAIVEPAPVRLPFWKKGCRYFNVLGPDGERLEFNQIL